MKERKFKCVRNLCVDVQPDQGRIGQSSLCEVDQQFRQGGREQNGLTILGKSAKNLAQLLAKSHFEKSETKKFKIAITYFCIILGTSLNLMYETNFSGLIWMASTTGLEQEN